MPMTSTIRQMLVVILVCAASFAPAARAQVVVQQAPAQPQQQRPDEILVRTYNVSDLLRLTADYPMDSKIATPNELGAAVSREWMRGVAGAGAGGGGQSLFAGEGVKVGVRAGPAIELDPLSKLIVDVVEPTSWVDNGGNVGMIRVISSMIVIVQTRANHETIQKLLDELRRTAGPAQIATVHATWLLVAQGELPKPMTEVSDDWIKRQKIYCESQITCFSGQTVHASSGRSKRVVTDNTPIVGTLSSREDPTVEAVMSGVMFQVSPLLIPGTDLAVIDVQSAASEWSKGADESARVENVDRVPMLCQEMKTTARVPLRKRVLIGGMTLDASDAEQGGRQLYLVVEIDGAK
jgi:hypothetical protein